MSSTGERKRNNRAQAAARHETPATTMRVPRIAAPSPERDNLRGLPFEVRRASSMSRRRRSTGPTVPPAAYRRWSSPGGQFRGWPQVRCTVPTKKGGVYTIWDQDGAFIYVGMATKNRGLRGRLAEHANGNRAGDRFNVRSPGGLRSPGLLFMAGIRRSEVSAPRWGKLVADTAAVDGIDDVTAAYRKSGAPATLQGSRRLMPGRGWEARATGANRRPSA